MKPWPNCCIVVPEFRNTVWQVESAAGKVRIVENFSFVIEDRLAGSARPGCHRSLMDDIAIMKEYGIGVLVSLTEATLDTDLIRGSGMEYHHLPVHDFTPPSQAQFRKFQEIVDRSESENLGAVLVHCAAGIGRTGSMIAAYLITAGKTADEAVSEVRRARPGSIETQAQVNALHEWEAQLSKSE